MKNLNYYFFLSLLVLAFTACDKDEKGDLEVHFKLKYGEQNLRMFENYSYPETGKLLNFTRFAFYISDFSVSSGSGSHNLVEVDYIDLTAAHTTPTSTDGFIYTIRDVPAGRYEDIHFGLGLPTDLNKKEPKDFPSSSVLSNTADYWSGWKSYIFVRNEGKIDLDGNGDIESNFALHLGGDEAFRHLALSKKFTISKDSKTSVDIEIDMRSLFNGVSLYDIQSTQQIHSISQMPLITQLANNLVMGIK